MAIISGNNDGPKAEMNVTPLIDVLLVLLIICMVITPFSPLGLDTLIPQPADKTTPPTPIARTIVVRVLTENGTERIKINDEEATWETLKPRLQRIFATRVERVAFIKGDADVEFATMAQVINVVREAGATRVGLLTAKLEEGR